MSRIALISEHYFPIVGGTTFLTKSISEHLALQGVEVHLIVPTPGFESSVVRNANNLFIHNIPIDSDIKIDLTRDQRLLFIKRTNYAIWKIIENYSISVVHVLCGIYSMKYLDIHGFKRAGIKVMATVINVPPQECGQSWSEDSLYNQVKDFIRKKLIKLINKHRILYHKWDRYFVISENGKRLLSEYINPFLIKVVPLGYDPAVISVLDRKRGKSVRILTVAGYVPHKNYHLLLPVAKALKEDSIEFSWTFIGPVRSENYYQHLVKQVNSLGLQENITVLKGMPQSEVYSFYKEADIYIQPSLEEGFCLTALDSITFSLPLIGVIGNSGAIGEFVKLGKGIMVNNSVTDLKDAISEIVNNPGKFTYSQERLNNIVNTYKWENVVKGYINEY